MHLDDLPQLKSIPPEIAALRSQLTERGRWAPLYVEPMGGSGERITFAIAVRTEDGAVEVARVIRPEVLRALYGSKAKHFSEMLAAAEAAAALSLGNGTEAIEFPISGFVAGPFRSAMGNSIKDLVDQGRMMSASLGTVKIDESSTADDDDERATNRWAQKIQEHVTGTAADLRQFFSRDWTPKGKTIPSKFGFFNGHYAAHFGVVHRRSPSGSLYHLKARLWELATAQSDDFTTILGRDLILARPNLTAATLSLAERERIRDVLDKVTDEADQHQIYVMHTDRVDSASRRLYKQARSLVA